jgi:hypothetical protein
MSRLVRLYPRAWRDRYENEFLDLLAERRLSPGDLVDTLRGAVDAHLHPKDNTEPQPWTHRLPGLLAFGGALAWTTAAALAAVGSVGGAWILFPITGGMLTLAAIRAGIGPRERWTLLTTTIAVQVVATLPFAIGSVTITGGWAAIGTLANFVPFGLAWVLIGLRLAMNGTPTITDPPVITNEPEVSAA